MIEQDGLETEKGASEKSLWDKMKRHASNAVTAKQEMVIKTLDWSYEKAVNGLPGAETAEELARSYLTQNGTLASKAESLVRWQIAKASTSGFVTGLGGFTTLPVAVPANVASVLYIQIRMIAAIAVIGKHDIRDDKVKALVYLCLCGNAVIEPLRDVGIKVGSRLTAAAINKISGATLTKINQAVGQRLLTKAGQTGAINFGKAVPIMGGLIGGTVDGVTTKAIGAIAITTFLTSKQKKKVTAKKSSKQKTAAVKKSPKNKKATTKKSSKK